MDKGLKPFAEAIGELCNEWAHLEQWVGRTFLAVGGWDYRLPNASLMVSCIDIRDQIRAARIGAINRCPPGAFLESVIECLDYVDNDLRNARNRFVHDIWASAEDGVGAIKANLTPRAIKTPGSGHREVQPWQNQYVSVEEVREITFDVINERQYLSAIVDCFLHPEQPELPAQLLERPLRLHLRRRMEKQDQAGTSGSKRKRPPKSSPA
ncbi:hypothetical protein [Rhodopila sp.]|uniref:hypothetical protein n=1 Tax=Rhodopila sp. TaxID=2480087 RepID=UPI003D125D96